MKNSKSIRQYKKDITRSFVQYDNETLVNMLQDGRRDEVINSLLPMVIFISSKYNSPNEFEELVSVGNIGLITGIDKFDIQRGGNLISYCNSSIRWGILDYLNLNRNIIRLPLSKGVSEKTLNLRPTTINIDGIDIFQLEDDSVLYEEKTTNRRDLEELLMTIPKMKYSKVMLFLDYYLTPGMTYEIISKKNDFTKQNTSLILKELLRKIKSNPQLMDKFREILL